MRESAVVFEAAYRQLFDCDISCYTFNDRLQAQKTAYILQAIGFNLGDYGYRWYKHGPYSQAVQDDLFFITNNLPVVKAEASQLEFTEVGYELLDQFQTIADERQDYDVPQWLEAVASIHYLQKYKVSAPNREKVITELERLKPHLNNNHENLRAWQTVQTHMNN